MAIVLLAIWISFLCGGAAACLRTSEREKWPAFLLGALLGPLGIVIVYFARSGTTVAPRQDPSIPPRPDSPIAPEPILRAYLNLLQQVILIIRNRSSMSNEQIFDLADAIHNVPVMLMFYGRGYSSESIRRDFAAYDAKWSTRGGPNLEKLLDLAFVSEELNGV